MGGMDWLQANTLWVLSGCVLLGISSGVLGSFALLRRRSLLGDALAHAALPGVCLAFMVTGNRALGPLLLGATLASLSGALAIQGITRWTRIKEDTALGLVLSVYFAVGIVLLTRIQKTGNANQAGLDKFIFGQAAAIVGDELYVMAGLALVVCLASLIFFKEFKLLCFDPGFARGLGYPVGLLDGLLLLLIVLAVVVGLQAVGVVMMASMLITPAASARFWTDRLSVMIRLAAVFGALSGALGAGFSAVASGWPTGPLIVLAASAMFLISFVFAPRRGLMARVLHQSRLRRRVVRENALRRLYEAAEAAGDWELVSGPAELEGSERGRRELLTGLQMLRGAGRVEAKGSGFQLTESGLEEAYQVVRNHRLWEMFLMHEGQLGADHVDRDADEIEHLLPAPVVAELEALLRVHGRTPVLPPSVHPLGA